MSENKTIAALLAGEEPDVQALSGLFPGQYDEELFSAADRVRKSAVGDVVHIRAIIEFSNHCKRACVYCGLYRENQDLPRYRMQKDEIVRCAAEAAEAGYKTVVLQSGEDSFFTTERLCEILTEVKALGLFITLGVGERPPGDYAAFKNAGADRYLLKHETADPILYFSLHSEGSLAERVSCLREIKAAGLETGGGFMVGLPGQTDETLARDCRLLRELSCDMAGIGPFIAHPRTPLADFPPGSDMKTLRAVAITRLLLPHSNLPATTALGVLSERGRDMVFGTGANVIMRKVTPWKYRRDYEIYPTNFGGETDIKTARAQLEEYIKALGKIPL